MSVQRCPQCGPDGQLETDLSAGNIVCQRCGQIVEEGILVSEVGFAESAGGRVHVQGTFVSNYATGVAGSRGGRGGQQNIENIKAQGASRIEALSRQMHLSSAITRGAIRFFSLAVDNKFNRGRKTDYIIASCLYLQCRLKKDAHMLIDFSEHKGINVFELGATYLKLRSTLNLLDPMPEVDPAIYNLRFAHRLNFGAQVNIVAADASRLVRRFRADWMTQGRRPAGVCGACLIIAGRMSNFLRTPDEVAQVVKVHPNTIKKRLLEFAQTDMAKKTVGEWRSLSESQLDEVSEIEKPPIVRQQERKRAQEERKRRFLDGEIDEEEEDEEDVDEESRLKKKAKLDKDKARPSEDDEQMTGALQAAAHDFEDANVVSGEDDEDDTLDPLAPSDYVQQLESARDDPTQAREERRRDRTDLLKGIKGFGQADTVEDVDMDELEQLAFDAEKLEDEDEEDEVDEDGDAALEPTQIKMVSQAEGSAKKNEIFDAWDDEAAVITFFEEKYFHGEKNLYQANMANRIKMWWGNRDPKEVHQEMEAVKRARWLREKNARQLITDLDDLDDDELEAVFVLDEDAKQARARMWLSSNGKWLEEEKEKQEKRAALQRARGNDPSKNKPKRKRTAPHKGPYKSSDQAVQSVIKSKQFSGRVNYDVLRGLGLTGSSTAGLVVMDDEKEEYEDEDEEEKGEDEGGYDNWNEY
ncbi:hypothetical protein AYX13_05912 [Cryptococcus neoformans]|nr:hypothetical protein AYX13_05912 [Cryptococcus neoformans var. grubii]